MKKIQLLSVAAIAILLTACSDMTDVENTIPTVKTGDVTNVTAHSATITVEGSDFQYYYLELSTSSSFSESSTQKFSGLSASAYSATGLLAGTTYFYRQCATDGLTVVNGPIRQFETPPVVSIASILMAPWNETIGRETVTGYELGLFFTAVDDGTDYPGLSNFQTQYNSETGTWSMPKEITPPEDTHIFYAYAPYNRAVVNKQAIPVDLTQSNTDYLCGESGNITYQACNANIVMHHALARVIFDVKKDKGNNDDVTVSSYWLLYDNQATMSMLPVAGTLDLTTSIVTPTQYRETLYRSIASVRLTDEPIELDFHVIPFEFGDETITFTLDNGSFSSTLPATEWKAGYQYRYPVTVKRNKLELGDVEITPWTEHTGGDIVINN